MVSLVKIGDTSCRHSGKIADKFFLFAALSGFIGTTYLGVHLLMMLSGIIEDTSNYLKFKQLHSYIQFYLFFGLFILGFLFQAGSKIFSTKIGISKHCIKLLVFPLTGVIILINNMESLIGKVFLIIPFLYAFYFLVKVFLKASTEIKIGLCLSAIMGIGTFIFSVFLNLTNLENALFLLWAGCGGIIFTAGQQFICNVFGGKKIGKDKGWIFLGLFILSSVSLFINFKLYISLSFFTLVFYLYATDFKKLYLKIKKDPLALAMILSFFWALIAPLLGVFNLINSDQILHIWASAWILPIMIFVSARVINQFSVKGVFSPQKLFILLFLWQSVPLTRGIFHLSNPFFSFVTSFIATIVLLVWLIGIIRGVFSSNA